MIKHDILEIFKDINFMYNDSSKLDTLSKMLDELIEDEYHKGYSDGYDAKAMEAEEDMT